MPTELCEPQKSASTATLPAATPALLALAERVEEQLPLALSIKTFAYFNAAGVSWEGLRQAVTWLVAHNRARVVTQYGGDYVLPVVPENNEETERG